jgi:hypothetical protein
MDEQVPTLASVLAQVPDPRAARGCRHPWSTARRCAGARRLGAEDTDLLSAYGQGDCLVLGEVGVPDATNELG